MSLRNFIALIFITIGLSGCASMHNAKRELNYRLVESCSTEQGTYLAATKEDLAYVFMPFFIFGDENSCNKYVAGSCEKLKKTWLLYAPFAAVDIPFALIRDIYEIPSDIKHSKNLQQCAD